eukprot:PITA_22318
MLALSAEMGWKIHQMDVKTAFLNGKIEEEVYIEQPEGFETSDRESHLCQLKRSLYELKKTPHDWYTRINNYFIRLVFTKSEIDVNLYHIMLSQAMVQPTKLFWKVAKHVLRYLRGTSQYGLWYRWSKGVKLQGFTYSDWAGSPTDQKSISGGIFNLVSAAVSSYNRKKRSVALSSVEVEYMAASQTACEAIWMKKILVGLFDQRMDPTVIYCDNQSCIKLCKNLVFHDKSKHISTKEQEADILMKVLSKHKFKFHIDKIGVADNPFLVEREC